MHCCSLCFPHRLGIITSEETDLLWWTCSTASSNLRLSARPVGTSVPALTPSTSCPCLCPWTAPCTWRSQVCLPPAPPTCEQVCLHCVCAVCGYTACMRCVRLHCVYVLCVLTLRVCAVCCYTVCMCCVVTLCVWDVCRYTAFLCCVCAVTLCMCCVRLHCVCMCCVCGYTVCRPYIWNFSFHSKFLSICCGELSYPQQISLLPQQFYAHTKNKKPLCQIT